MPIFLIIGKVNVILNFMRRHNELVLIKSK